MSRLAGPEGCDFRGDDPGTQRWTCDGSRQRPLARAILGSMGLSDDQIAVTLAWREWHGGYCDCEILLNVDRASEEP